MGVFSSGKFAKYLHTQIYLFWCILNNGSKLFVRSDLLMCMFSPIFSVDIISDLECCAFNFGTFSER